MKTSAVLLFLILSASVCFGHDGDMSEHARSVVQHSHRQGEGDHRETWSCPLPHVQEEHDALEPNGLIPGCEGLHNHITCKLKKSVCVNCKGKRPPSGGDKQKSLITVDGIEGSITDDFSLLRSLDSETTGNSRICYATEATLTLWRAAFSVKELDYPTITLQHDTDAGLFDNNPLLKPFRLDVVVKSDAHEMAQDGRCGAVLSFDKAGLTYQNENIVYWADDTDTIDVDFTDTAVDISGISETTHCDVDTLGEWTSIEIRHANCVLWTLSPEAPSAPSLQRNKTTTWASLKMQ